MKKKKEDLPFVTVLMAVYNGERWLAESITSILNQTFNNFEFIIINDGSIDSSSQILNHFANEDPRIRIFNKENSGLADSLNYGLAEARGEWVARIDADDICNSQRLQKQIEYIRSDADLVLVGAGLVIIDKNGLKSEAYHYPDKHDSIMRRLYKGLPFFAHSSAFFKLNVVQELGGYRTQFKRSQDQDLWLRLGQVGKISCARDPLVLIRKHDEQISNDDSGQQQSIYSHMAMTSYYLRLIDQIDPLESDMEEEHKTFYDFINQRLKDSDFFDNKKNLDRLKKDISSELSKFAKYRLIAKNLFFKPVFIYRYMKFRFFGSSLPREFADKWKKNSDRSDD